MLKWHDGRKPIKKMPRWIMAIVLLVLLYALLQIFIPTIFGNVEAGEAGSEVYVEHVVSGGETLWDIAVMHRPDADPRAVVWETQLLHERRVDMEKIKCAYCGQTSGLPAEAGGERRDRE